MTWRGSRRARLQVLGIWWRRGGLFGVVVAINMVSGGLNQLTNQRILINYSLWLLEYSGEFPAPEKLIKAVFVRVSRGFRSDDDWWVEWNGMESATRWVGVCVYIKLFMSIYCEMYQYYFDAYRDSILDDLESSSLTIFRTVFSPPSTTDDRNPNYIVAASSDGSIASYSLSSLISSVSPAVGSSRAQNLFVAEPDCLINGHDGPTYDVKFYGDAEDSLLLSCGDDGRIRGWKWMDMFEAKQNGGLLKPQLDLANPQHKGPWGALSPIPETNAIAVDTQGGSIYAAAGDSCAYCWDVEKSKIKLTFKGHSGYLHSVVARNSCNQIITGSEDGTARIWDCRSGKCTNVIEPGKDKKSKEFFSYVSCIALDANEKWLACGSGRNLSVWNLSASERISGITTRAFIQDICFDDNQILAVGAEPVLSRYDINGVMLSQIQCVPRSTFSVSLHLSGVCSSFPADGDWFTFERRASNKHPPCTPYIPSGFYPREWKNDFFFVSSFFAPGLTRCRHLGSHIDDPAPGFPTAHDSLYKLLVKNPTEAATYPEPLLYMAVLVKFG
ncbi:THO complex subunit 6-like [Bidens hawaiensis]|uniref:THO complex subunit 6-like n=1 Tax=Bidens hawaiensis TaxID=980011 RepID=UPI00404A4C8E